MSCWKERRCSTSLSRELDSKRLRMMRRPTSRCTWAASSSARPMASRNARSFSASPPVREPPVPGRTELRYESYSCCSSTTSFSFMVTPYFSPMASTSVLLRLAGSKLPSASLFCSSMAAALPRFSCPWATAATATPAPTTPPPTWATCFIEPGTWPPRAAPTAPAPATSTAATPISAGVAMPDIVFCTPSISCGGPNTSELARTVTGAPVAARRRRCCCCASSCDGGRRDSRPGRAPAGAMPQAPPRLTEA
mmetsp:Transcript_32358/g.81633  ORF Transcript_32358/g.81633 Transcript_32358/m.81633 type:complete len:252 (+) Transcript_32358:2442-3197(+)